MRWMRRRSTDRTVAARALILLRVASPSVMAVGTGKVNLCTFEFSRFDSRHLDPRCVVCLSRHFCCGGRDDGVE